MSEAILVSYNHRQTCFLDSSIRRTLQNSCQSKTVLFWSTRSKKTWSSCNFILHNSHRCIGYL